MQKNVSAVSSNTEGCAGPGPALRRLEKRKKKRKAKGIDLPVQWSLPIQGTVKCVDNGIITEKLSKKQKILLAEETNFPEWTEGGGELAPRWNCATLEMQGVRPSS